MLSCIGKLVVRGNPSKIYQPFTLLGGMKGTKEELKDKLLIDFDPVKCFIKDLEASEQSVSIYFRLLNCYYLLII